MALTIDFKLSGKDNAGAAVELSLNKQTIAPGVTKAFNFDVSLNAARYKI